MELREVGAMREAVRKVPGGKMLRVTLDSSGSTIRRVIITGDFFFYPEDLLPELETLLQGHEINASLLTSTIEEFLRRNNATLIGASAADLASVIMSACSP